MGDTAYQDFVLAIKSTIDKVGRDIAADMGISLFVDIDDTVNASEALMGPDDVVMWRLLTTDEAPRDPLYSVKFMIGIKTSYDAANYDLLGFVGRVKEAFRVEGSLDIFDWSGAIAPTEKVGYLVFYTNSVDPHASEEDAGYRMVAIEARAARTVV